MVFFMKNIILLCLMSLPLVACGVEDHPRVVVEEETITLESKPTKPPSLCAIECLGDVYSQDGGLVVCSTIAKNVDLILNVYASTGIATKETVCPILSEVDLYVRPEQDGWKIGSAVAGGHYWDRRITMVQNMVGLGHETLHAYEDALKLVDWSNPHGGWDTKPGYSQFLQTVAWKACHQDPAYNKGKTWCE